MFEYNATVTRVVDGDTIDAMVDLGFSTHKKVRIRMMGINAPESRTRNLEEKAKGLAAKIRDCHEKGYYLGTKKIDGDYNIVKQDNFDKNVRYDLGNIKSKTTQIYVHVDTLLNIQFN